MRELVIQTDAEGKGRSFRAALLAYTTSRSLWESGKHDNTRPIWAMMATTEAESLPFIRNLQNGRQAVIIGEEHHGRRKATEKFECLRSAGYEYQAQRHPEGVVWTVFLPELYRIDPGMVDPSGVRFAIAPAVSWLADTHEPIARWLANLYRSEERWKPEEEDARRLDTCRYVTRLATLFCAYLDRRTRCPLIPDPRFYALVLAAMLDSGQAALSHDDGGYGRTSKWAHGRFDYVESDIDCVGTLPGLACMTNHEQLEPLLADCVRRYEATATAHNVRKAA